MKAIVHVSKWSVIGEEVEVNDYEIEISDKTSLEQLQEIVGGYIEVVRFKEKDLIVNEEGLLHGLPLNYWAMQNGLNLVGTIVEINGRLK